MCLLLYLQNDNENSYSVFPGILSNRIPCGIEVAHDEVNDFSRSASLVFFFQKTKTFIESHHRLGTYRQETRELLHQSSSIAIISFLPNWNFGVNIRAQGLVPFSTVCTVFRAF